VGSTPQAWGLLLIGLLAANLPFLTERRLLVLSGQGPKSLGWRLLELLLLSGLLVAIGMAIETRLGQRAPQEWAFYAVVLCLMLTFAFPGFVWRHLRRKR
jgi:Protein of unknown function (DUF2818)